MLCIATGIVYLWLTPDDRHHAKQRKSAPAVPLTPRLAFMLFGLFMVIALSAGLIFNVLTIALPKIVDERLGDARAAGAGRQHRHRRAGLRRRWRNCPSGALVECVPPHVIFAVVTGLGVSRQSVGGLCRAACADGRARGRGRRDLRAGDRQRYVLARYTADAWRGRVYAVRYFLLFISAGAAIGMISLLHERGGFALVLGVNAVIALVHVPRDARPGGVIISIESRQAARAAGGITQNNGGIRSSTLTARALLDVAPRCGCGGTLSGRGSSTATRPACPT